MSTLTVILPLGIRITVAPWRWLAAGMCALLMMLMWGFVAVLQQGVERGDRMRAEQLQAATQPTAAKVRVAPVKTAKADARTQP